jgi:hypothetical protein
MPTLSYYTDYQRVMLDSHLLKQDCMQVNLRLGAVEALLLGNRKASDQQQFLLVEKRFVRSEA